jgi:hypothetical protein
VQELPQHRLACSVRIEDGSVEMQWWRGGAASGDAMTTGMRGQGGGCDGVVCACRTVVGWEMESGWNIR